MKTVLRVLGVELISRLGARLPGPWARTVSLVVLLVANAIPVLGVWQGWLGYGDVFLLYWLENVVVWLTSTIRIMTAGPEGARRQRGLAFFFAMHYGIFTVVHGVFTGVLTALAGGLKGSALAIGLSLALLVGSHVVNLAFFWFAHGGRFASSPQRAMVAPYPRMIVLHVCVIASGFFLFGSIGQAGPDREAQFWPVLLLCGLKTFVDLGGVFLADRVRAGSMNVSLTINGRQID